MKLYRTICVGQLNDGAEIGSRVLHQVVQRHAEHRVFQAGNRAPLLRVTVEARRPKASSRLVPGNVLS